MSVSVASNGMLPTKIVVFVPSSKPDPPFTPAPSPEADESASASSRIAACSSGWEEGSRLKLPSATSLSVKDAPGSSIPMKKERKRKKKKGQRRRKNKRSAERKRGKEGKRREGEEERSF